ncbi:MAG: TonB family protein, partial [Myxococcales bacterium]|nr:TonB family protein [Myxococcales bacterium]
MGTPNLSPGRPRVMAPIAAVLLLAASLPSPLAAQPSEPEPEDPAGEQAAPPVILPPRLLEFVEADYPEAAEAEGLEAAVILEITIAVDGAVTEAAIVSPAGHGFDEAAEAAVRLFRFEPATRDGEPMAAVIRYRYVFELRAPEPPAADPLEPAAPARGRIEGRLLGLEDGAAIAGAEVQIRAPDGQTRTMLTGPEGRFRFDELDPGSYALSLYALEYGEEEHLEQVEPGEVTELLYRMQITSQPGGVTYGAEAVVDPPPREVTRRTIEREQLTTIPGTRGDALRTVEILPGVARPAFGFGALLVRGSSGRDSAVNFEGNFVPLLYHFGGLTSFANSRMLERIDFYPGNFSARYG